jgi:hypothetical protein
MSTASPIQRRSALAIASLALGIFGFVTPVVPSILAIMFGIAAKRRMRDDPTLRGDRLATAGIALGIVELVLAALVLTSR